ncbi:MAG: SpoIIE family protein phosphatase [Acidobacteriota bacterium]|jgi:PAS domain S-box-containing protein|nr:SpoIIE family protein phosphatase [Acidobacteriota bacterium]
MIDSFNECESGTFPDEPAILKSTLYHLSEGVVVADRDGRFLLCNQTARKLLKIAADGGAPRMWSDIKGCYKADEMTLYAPDEMPNARAVSGEDVSVEIFIRGEQQLSGLWITVRANPLRGEGGEIRGSVVVFNDITGRIKRDTRLRVLTSAVEQTADSVIITDRGGIIEYVNPALESTTGYSLEELKGLTPRILNSGVHDRMFYENLWATILSGKVFRATMANKKKSGEVFYAEQVIAPMWGPAGIITHLVTIFRDATEQRKLQEQQFQMGLARAVQRQFYEPPPPRVEGFDFAAAAFPADAIGGDYLDFVSMPGGCIGFAVGDVCGHGISSALLMAGLRAYIRAFAPLNHDPAEIFTRTNKVLVSDMGDDKFVTMIYCRLNPATRSLVYSSAGHTPGFILGRNGEVRRTLDSTDMPLGFMGEHTFNSSDEIALEPGDVLALLTDGIVESENPEQDSFGMERTVGYIREHRGESAGEIVSGLYRAVRKFSDGMPQTDDVTAVICKIT